MAAPSSRTFYLPEMNRTVPSEYKAPVLITTTNQHSQNSSRLLHITVDAERIHTHGSRINYTFPIIDETSENSFLNISGEHIQEFSSFNPVPARITNTETYIATEGLTACLQESEQNGNCSVPNNSE